MTDSRSSNTSREVIIALRNIQEEVSAHFLMVRMQDLAKLVSSIAKQFQSNDREVVSSVRDVTQATQRITSIEHSLLNLDFTHQLCSSIMQSTRHILEAFRFAILLSTTYYFKVMPLNSVSVTSLRARLLAELEAAYDSKNDSLDMASLTVLLWSSWIGGLAAEDQHRFADHISHYLEKVRLSSLGELEGFLQDYALAGRLCSSHKGSLWTCVAQRLCSNAVMQYR